MSLPGNIPHEALSQKKTDSVGFPDRETRQQTTKGAAYLGRNEDNQPPDT